MKRVFAFVLGAALSVSVAYAQPKLKVEGGDTYNWGKVKPSQLPLNTTLKVSNAGDQELRISEVKVGCGCTTTGIAKKELAPGETTTLTVTVNPGSALGSLTKSMNIMSNDPATPNLTVYLKADIVRPVQFVPTQYLTFSDMKTGENSQAKLRIKNTSGRDLTLSDVETTSDIRHNLKAKTVIKDGAELEITANVIARAKGYFSGMVTMKTDDPDMPLIEIPAYGNVTEQPASKAMLNK